MKDEIKEIIDKLKSLDYDEYNLEVSVDYIERKEEKLLLDCITNLQQKYDKALTDLVQESHTRMELENKITNLQEENERLSVELNKNMIERNNYLSRNEKAIEYIKNKQELNKMFGTITLSKDSQNELLSILGGDDNE